MRDDRTLRKHVLYLLRGGGAHLDFDRAVGGLAPAVWGKRVPGISHTPWRIVEHMRICQWDILEFCRNPSHESPTFPEGYWPAGDAPPDAATWEGTLRAFRRDLKALEDLVADANTDLLAPIPHGDGQTILREALLAADHNAYHLGQLVIVRKALHAWQE